MRVVGQPVGRWAQGQKFASTAAELDGKTFVRLYLSTAVASGPF
jgi:hypothetical protein